MASSSTITCGVCESQHTTKKADVWCPECDEGLCSQCLKHHNASKATRAHGTILVDNYKQLPPFIANISQYCSLHDIKFQNYCPQHESLCCQLCIQSNHATCNEILSLENVVQTAKTSSLLESLDQNIKNLKISVNRVVDDLKQNLDEIQKQRQKFYDDIKQVRNKINEHLDSLEHRVIHDLYAAETEIKSHIEDLIGKLAENSECVNSMQNNISAIKDYASNIQAFLGSKMIETEIQKYEIFMQSLFDDGSLQKMDINCKIEDKITDVLSTITSLGTISIESSSPLVVIKTEKETQAQTRSLNHVPPLTINDITLTLQSKFNFPGITGCTISSKEEIILIDFNYKRVLILKEDGTLKSEILLSTSSPVDVACIDDKSFAVSFPSSNLIQIINISTERVEQRINTTSLCFGLCYRDGYLLYCDTGRGIQKVNMADNCSFTLVKDDTLSKWSYVATFKNNIFYTNSSNFTITCCYLTGEKMWEYADQSVLSPYGIAVDKDSNVYVASYGNNSLCVLSSDGKQARKLLGYNGEVNTPFGLAFDAKKEKIIVATYYEPKLYRL